MKTEKKIDDETAKAAAKKALAEGRNANDNFQNHDSDDYGTSDDDQGEMTKRNDIKGGAGQHGKGRNRNDDFNTEE